MPATVTSMSQAQLAAALSDLEMALNEGEAELKQKPDQYQMVKTLYTELKKLKPGQTPNAKLTAFSTSSSSEEVERAERQRRRLRGLH